MDLLGSSGRFDQGGEDGNQGAAILARGSRILVVVPNALYAHAGGHEHEPVDATDIDLRRGPGEAAADPDDQLQIEEGLFGPPQRSSGGIAALLHGELDVRGQVSGRSGFIRGGLGVFSEPLSASWGIVLIDTSLGSPATDCDGEAPRLRHPGDEGVDPLPGQELHPDRLGEEQRALRDATSPPTYINAMGGIHGAQTEESDALVDLPEMGYHDGFEPGLPGRRRRPLLVGD
ncbi:hypothetical protein Tdes44962_MAKER08205 [Teratosphaeria destructans]|uniref:Uncharacterized protein n=1 Tax=Teratosphaeria destructans TaxID=418781 RepID=A0A9W7SX83_9PEZI|nr:hypothetical protein Tdes44962_MAKER08205 [Teratosphaeria destructans]